MSLLEIKDLHAGFEGTEIVTGVSLTVNPGEVHAIMGPNGSGKSTLAKVLVGHPSYVVTQGSITYNGKDLLEMDAEDRALAGVFMGFQYPVEIPGVNNAEFLRMAYNAKLVKQGQEEVDPLDFDEILDKKMKLVGMDKKYKDRFLNEGFSGGEKKKNEILQMAVLDIGKGLGDQCSAHTVALSVRAASIILSPSAASAPGTTPRFRGRRWKPVPPSPGNIPAVFCRATTPRASFTRWR